MFVKNLIDFIKGSLPVSGVVVLTGITALSTGIGAAKIIDNIRNPSTFLVQSQVQNKNVEESQDNNTSGASNPGVLGANTNSLSPGKTNLPTGVKSADVLAATKKLVLNISPTRIITPPQSSNFSSNCIITLFGKQYDITSLLTTHSGGNVFQCGTDMTASYQSRHGTNLSRMAPYLVNTSTPTNPAPRPTQPPTITPLPRIPRDDDDDRGDD